MISRGTDLHPKLKFVFFHNNLVGCYKNGGGIAAPTLKGELNT